jgi:hypothetical protein
VPGPRQGDLGLRARLLAGVTAAIGAVTGLAPHVLHHLGPIAGAALIGGAGGTALFAVLGFALSVPFLLRLRRRFGSWRAPIAALAVLATMFALSSLVIGPAIRGGDEPSPAAPSRQTPSGHLGHH